MRSVWMVFVLFLFAAAVQAPAQSEAATVSDPPHFEWTASWISHPTAELREPGVFHFRRTLSISLLSRQVTWFESARTTVSCFL